MLRDGHVPLSVLVMGEDEKIRHYHQLRAQPSYKENSNCVKIQGNKISLLGIEFCFATNGPPLSQS